MHEIGPGILLRDGMATDYCSQDTPDISKDDIITALMADECHDTFVKRDQGWAETHCENNNGCSIGFGESASLALPGLLGLIAAVWAGRRAARRRYRSWRPRLPQ